MSDLVKVQTQIIQYLLNILDRAHSRMGKYGDPGFSDVCALVASEEPQPGILIRTLARVEDRMEEMPPRKFMMQWVSYQGVITETLLTTALLVVLRRGSLDTLLIQNLANWGRQPHRESALRALFTTEEREGSGVEETIRRSILDASCHAQHAAGPLGSSEVTAEEAEQRKLLDPLEPVLQQKRVEAEVAREFQLREHDRQTARIVCESLEGFAGDPKADALRREIERLFPES